MFEERHSPVKERNLQQELSMKRLEERGRQQGLWREILEMSQSEVGRTYEPDAAL